ncbi:MAG: hypothetical protein R3E61_07490 [Pseudomonadales bacterium]
MKLVDFLKSSLLLRLVLAYGAILAAVFVIISIFFTARVGLVVNSAMDAYGSAVAEQLAQNTLDATLQHDQIGLQAQLSRLMKVSSVVSVSIYDASNNLLAQAGATPSELQHRDYLRNYSATLSLGDNMTGSVVVTLETEKIEHLFPETQWLLAVLVVLAMVLFVLLSYHFTREIREQRTALAEVLLDTVPQDVMEACFAERPLRLSEQEMRQLMAQLHQHTQQIQTPSQAQLNDAATNLLHNNDGYVYVLLECHNIDVLQRQVSRDRLRTLLDQLQQQVKKTARLYNAQRMPTAGSCIKLVMPADSVELADVLLRAACCAEVLIGVLQACRDEELGIQLQWSLALDRHLPCDNDILRNRQLALEEQRSHWLCHQVGNGQLAVSADVGELLQSQEKLSLAAEHGESGKPFFRIASFAQSQRALLDGQIARLLEH